MEREWKKHMQSEIEKTINHKCSHTKTLNYTAQPALILSFWGAWHILIIFSGAHSMQFDIVKIPLYICTNWSGRIKVHEHIGCPYRFVFPEDESWPSPLVHDDGHVATILWSSVTWHTGHLCSRISCQGKTCRFPSSSAQHWRASLVLSVKDQVLFLSWSTWTISLHTSTCVEKTESKGKRRFTQDL